MKLPVMTSRPFHFLPALAGYRPSRHNQDVGIRELR